ncbi:MAG: helix-turn-helix domain-containing protein [Coriobacteriia bacterium]|nr:helix-turn-helix domain-containing protein [Coriobacteriia bacterium]MCL2870643.1 helix-turn-helix domain-containing protein [Coriobacteriia bacterium]
MQQLDAKEQESKVTGISSELSDYPKVLSVKQAAKILTVSPQTIRKLLYEKQLHGRLVGKHWKIRLSEIDRFLGGQS